MTVLAVYNSKGGVGKTAAAVNLSFLAARQGSRTLVWDLDPQGAATFYFRVRPKVKGGARKLLKKSADPAARVRGTDFPQLDLLPSDLSYRHLDIALDQAKSASRRLSRVLQPLAETYDFVFLDCPPSVSLLSEAVFGVADALLVPIVPTTLSLRTLDQLTELLQREGVVGVDVLPFFSMVDRRKKLHRQILETLPQRRSDMLEARIPYASDVERMGIERRPLACYAPGCPSAKAYAALWAEIVERLRRRSARGLQ